MADGKNKRGPADRSRISRSEDYEVRYWTHELGVTRDELAAASPKLETTRGGSAKAQLARVH